MNFNDDEPIKDVPSDTTDNSSSFVAGKTKLTPINKPEAPLEKGNFKVLLELTGTGAANDRSGVDLVTVLDVSGSMGTEKLNKAKIAMQFLIKKLSPIDRLSVVCFSDDARRLCPLRQVTEKSQDDIVALVNREASGGNTNIVAGLQTALKILDDRRLKSGRVVAVMLMSDGEQNRGGDAAKVNAGKVPVYTFGFGADHDPKVLKSIADSSNGGTFSDVQNQDNLSIAFSQCLAGLLTVVVQDLKMVIKQDESEIETVSAGNYPQTRDKAAGTVTISFGDLYNKEVRKIIVDVLLPAVERRRGSDILLIDYDYNPGGNRPRFPANRVFITITRTGESPEVQPAERKEVVIEMNRLQTAKMMKEARVMADEKKLEDAKDKLVEAENMLEDVPVDDHPLIQGLKTELQQLLRLMRSQDIYEKKGRPFALSSETSHERQRFAARGDDMKKVRLFATPRMDAYLEQAEAFDADPRKPLPSAEEDVKEELAADPLAPIVGALGYYIQTAIQALQSIEKVLNSARG